MEKRMKKMLSLLEDNICAIILLTMTLLTCVNVFARYVLNSSMPFVEELTSPDHPEPDRRGGRRQAGGTSGTDCCDRFYAG